jgi:hypothetical protein
VIEMNTRLRRIKLQRMREERRKPKDNGALLANVMMLGMGAGGLLLIVSGICFMISVWLIASPF